MKLGVGDTDKTLYLYGIVIQYGAIFRNQIKNPLQVK